MIRRIATLHSGLPNQVSSWPNMRAHDLTSLEARSWRRHREALRQRMSGRSPDQLGCLQVGKSVLHRSFWPFCQPIKKNLPRLVALCCGSCRRQAQTGVEVDVAVPIDIGVVHFGDATRSYRLVIGRVAWCCVGSAPRTRQLVR